MPSLDLTPERVDYLIRAIDERHEMILLPPRNSETADRVPLTEADGAAPLIPPTPLPPDDKPRMRQRLRNPGFLAGSGFFSGARERSSAAKCLKRFSLRSAPFFGNHHRVGAIRPFLANQAFDPETIRDMTLALERVCATLDLPVQDEPATRLVAKKIIELAQRGLRGNALSSTTLKEFKYDE